ncbi:IclR family transcriptional regulator [Paenibacillus sp. FSL R7-0026]|uniref:IclR family transcriptional regulator n=1 Tax=Paenibacillus sp. FSL R7-0026 TaxID=2921668 RepID=UPI0030FA3BAF
MSEVGTLKKGIDILWLIIEKGNLSVTDIMDTLSINRSTAYRLVNTLEQNSLIERAEDHTYIVSSVLMSKLQDHSLNFDFNLGILRVADELKTLTGETIFIGVLNDDSVLATHIIPGSFPTRTHYEKGEKLPVIKTAVGRCILAFQSPEIQEHYIQQIRNTDPSDVESFINELEQIKKSGFAVDNEEAEAGVRCVAAPIWRRGQAVAGIAISGPSVRVCQVKDQENSDLVKRFSEIITSGIESK